jgi:RNA-directed DNA polymerase
MMNGHGKSDSPILPAKSVNKAESKAAESMEERGLTKGNGVQQNTHRTQSRSKDVSNALDRVRKIANEDRNVKFTALLHHVTIQRLREAFFGIKKNASAGVDGVTWRQYEQSLEGNLENLHSRLHRGAYRAKPSRRAYIPKGGGRMRPLGIAALEDKIVQRAVAEVINAIYEADFLGFSYGFRPGRRPHEALDALAVAIQFKKVSFVLDADIQSYFDSIDHKWMEKFIEQRIADKRILRLIKKWLKAGVVEDGQWRAGEEGAPQGASISPLLSNVYLHYVLDLWAQQWRRRHARGDVVIIRWADDFVVGFQYQAEAKRFLSELHERFQKFSLTLHPEKTRLIRFGRFAKRDCKRFEGRSKPETFNFLGFTHCCSVNRNGKFKVMRKSMRSRFVGKLRAVKEELRTRMHQPVKDQGLWLRSVLLGYYAYHAVPGNWERIGEFRTQIARIWYKTLRRRSQKSTITWERMPKLVKRWLPAARILHPWPEERFLANHPR